MTVVTITKEMDSRQFNDYGRKQRAKYFWMNHISLSKQFVLDGHRMRTDFNRFSKAMNNVKNSEAIALVAKENKKGTENGFVLEFAMLLTEISNNIIYGRAENRRLDDDEQAEVLNNYRKAIYRILKVRIDDFIDKTKIDSKLLAIELLSIVPVPTTITKERFVGIYVNKVLNKLYTLAGVNQSTEGDEGHKPVFVPRDAEDIYEVFKYIFGEERIVEVATSVLLSGNDWTSRVLRSNDSDEKREAINDTYKYIEEFALTTISSLPTDEVERSGKTLKSEINNFARRRARDLQRNRITKCVLSTADLDKYKRLRKQIDKFIDRNPESERVFQ